MGGIRRLWAGLGEQALNWDWTILGYELLRWRAECSKGVLRCFGGGGDDDGILSTTMEHYFQNASYDQQSPNVRNRFATSDASKKQYHISDV